jgi:hypothetical protein
MGAVCRQHQNVDSTFREKVHRIVSKTTAVAVEDQQKPPI